MIKSMTSTITITVWHSSHDLELS